MSLRLAQRASSLALRSLRSRSFAAAASLDGLVKTECFDLHVELGGDMVPFAGYTLPVLYKDLGVMKEHLWCRGDNKASLFDVSHMGQIKWHGKDRVEVLERLVVGDIAGLAESNGCLSLITNECGGILDDTVITNAGNYTYMVVNGATKHDDIKHFETIIQSEFSNKDVTFEYLGDTVQLLAVQGPGAAAAVAKLCNVDLTRMAFMTGTETTLDGIKGCRITRCGYTGEDGFELSMPAQHAVSIAQKLLDDDTVQPAGLGARDSLRLEAGLCLYGNDLDSSTTPVEAALGWTMGPPKSRRRLEGGFLGAEHILKNGKFKEVARKRVGIAGMKAPARDGVPILDMEGNPIGSVTSGTFSPCLKKPIAMGYVETGHSKVGTAIQLQVRGKLQAAEVSKMPFVESHYYRVAE